jgi:hypothetical protein
VKTDHTFSELLLSPRRYQLLSWLAVAAVLWLTGSLVAPTTAAADVRGVFRLGLEPIALEPSDDMPLLGDHVDDAVTAYNAAASAYNRAHGYAVGSPMATAAIDRSDLGLHRTLVTFAPGLELGGTHAMVRIEGLLGFSDNVRALGIGLYPVDLALPLRGGSITPYLLAGGTLRWLDRTDTDGDTGGLVTFRAALGARIARHAIVELGVGLYMFGGLYNRTELQSMMKYDPRGGAPLPEPDRAVAGGKQSGMIDISVGFAL